MFGVEEEMIENLEKEIEKLLNEIKDLHLENEDLKNRLSEIYGIARDVV